jgi:hypothetical protein
MKRAHPTSFRTGVLAALLIAGLTACASTPESTGQPDTMSIQGQPAAAAISTPAVAPVPTELPVQSGNVSLPFDQLGMLTYDEPYSPRAIDEDHIDEKLRAMALSKWGNQVDAVVGVTTSLSPDRSEVTVEAEGVHVRGDCSFCRRGVTAAAATIP